MCLYYSDSSNVKHYNDPFWYERKSTSQFSKLYWKVQNVYAVQKENEQRKRLSASFVGTKPDIEIRW